MAMLSTDNNFILDQYCQGIKLGLCLDLDDETLTNEFRNFADAAAKEFISSENRSLPETVSATIESEEIYYPKIQPRLDAKNYNTTTAVKYAREWTEEGKKLSNPNFERYDADCTNFVSQVLYAGGISQIKGDRKVDSSWFYEWGLIARPSYTWDKIYLTYHTTDREDYPASNLIGGNNNYVPYAWTIN